MSTKPITTDPRFRWIVVTAAALLLGMAMGMLVNGLSAFVIPLEIHFGWNRADVAAINSFGLIGIALGGIPMGFLADRFSTRTICLTGAMALIQDPHGFLLGRFSNAGRGRTSMPLLRRDPHRKTFTIADLRAWHCA